MELNKTIKYVAIEIGNLNCIFVLFFNVSCKWHLLHSSNIHPNASNDYYSRMA